MLISRRDALRSSALAAAALAIGSFPRSAFGAAKEIPIGLQLYSVRDDCAKDLPGVLAAVAKMGYQGVEFAGYHGRSAPELRKLLDDNGLKCCGTHTPYDTILPRNLAATVEFNRILGNRYLIVPSLPGGQTSSVAALQRTAGILTRAAAAVKDHDMVVGYHAHAGDFQKFDGKTHWDILFENAGPGVVMQLDTCNCTDGGGDPVAILKKFADRALTIHLKEAGGPQGAVIGEGVVKFKEIFAILEKAGKTEWYILEQESYAGSPLDSVKRTLAAMHKVHG